MPQVLSIQSAVAYGFAGNSAAVFSLRRQGVDVWPVLTVNFSNHTGYGSWRGPLIAAEEIWAVVQGIDERGVLSNVDAVLSGYQGGEEVGAVILDAVALVKQRNPQAIYCCDPVMGDVDRGFYARPGIPELMRDLVTKQTDIMTPNLFELEFLTGRSVSTIAEAIDAAQALRAMGPETVLVTSAVGLSGDDDIMRMLAVNSTGCWQVETPLLDRKFTGSGDLTSSVFLAALLKGEGLGDALSTTAGVVYSVLKITTDLDRLELALVQAQDELVAPSHTFEAVLLR